MPLVAALIALAGVGVAAHLGWKVWQIAVFGAPSPDRGTGETRRSATNGPNLLFVTLDTCRADHLGVYGYRRQTSPNIDRMAKDGVVFTEAFTVATYSAPSHATMLTGLYPRQHGLTDNGLKLSGEVRTLAELLRQIRYRTAGFAGYYALGTETGLNRGFDTFEMNEISSHDHGEKAIEREVAGFRAAAEWLREWHRGTGGGQGSGEPRAPFFLWFHAQQIHQSYDPPAPYDSLFLDVPHNVEVAGFEDFELRCSDDVREALRRDLLSPEMEAQVAALYDGEIRLVDDELGRLFDYLREIGVYDNTMIVVLADHGELLFEDNKIDLGLGRFLHGQVYLDPVVRIPLIIKPPAGAIPQVGSRTAVTASTVDILPTVTELLGVDLPAALPGRSLVPWIKNPDQGDPREAVYFQESPDGTVWAGLRDAEWKYLRMTEDGETTRWLINHRADPDEQLDLYKTEGTVAERMEQHLDRWLSKQQAVMPSPAADMSGRMREALREAGYLRDKPGSD